MPKNSETFVDIFVVLLPGYDEDFTEVLEWRRLGLGVDFLVLNGLSRFSLEG